MKTLRFPTGSRWKFRPCTCHPSCTTPTVGSQGGVGTIGAGGDGVAWETGSGTTVWPGVQLATSARAASHPPRLDLTQTSLPP